MRMRRKKNLEGRLADCGEYIIYMDRDDRNYQIKDTDHIISYKDIFKNDNPVELEIGCGKGGFAREIAKRNPDINYLAVEKSSNVIVEAAELAIEENIPNLRFVRGGAEYLDCYIPSKSVKNIYLNFSCPYPKKSYASHRLTPQNFLEIYKKLLCDGGEIYQKTDNMHFFEFSIEQFSKSGFAMKNVTFDLHKSGFEGNIMTEYERKFSEQGMPIYRLEAYILNGKD